MFWLRNKKNNFYYWTMALMLTVILDDSLNVKLTYIAGEKVCVCGGGGGGLRLRG